MNAATRRQRRAADLALFMKQYGRKSSKRNGFDPNDRHYDYNFQTRVRRMKGAQLDQILRDGEGGDTDDVLP